MSAVSSSSASKTRHIREHGSGAWHLRPAWMVEVTCRAGSTQPAGDVTNTEKTRTSIEAASSDPSLNDRPMVADKCHKSGESVGTLRRLVDKTTASFFLSLSLSLSFCLMLTCDISSDLFPGQEADAVALGSRPQTISQNVGLPRRRRGPTEFCSRRRTSANSDSKSRILSSKMVSQSAGTFWGTVALRERCGGQKSSRNRQRINSTTQGNMDRTQSSTFYCET